MLKMETEKSISIFLSFLEDYIGHFIGSPHSLLVKILGVYSVRVARARRRRKSAAYFIVMQSVFWPSSRLTSLRQKVFIIFSTRIHCRIAEKFDVKGCLSGRRENAEKFKKKGWADGKMNGDGGDDDDDDEAEPDLVLKDANFHTNGVILNFGANRGWFVEQVS